MQQPSTATLARYRQEARHAMTAPVVDINLARIARSADQLIASLQAGERA